jgi:hypothetical protein
MSNEKKEILKAVVKKYKYILNIIKIERINSIKYKIEINDGQEFIL